MERYKYLFKNIGLLTLSNFGTKLLSFFLVPLYTSILTTAEYGSYDLLYTTTSLLIPIFSIDIIDSVLRFSLDEKSDKQEVFSIGIKVIGKSLIFLAILLLINHFVGFLNVINQYLGYFILFYVAHMVLQLMQFFSRGIDHVADLSVSGVLNTAVMIALNILFLVVIRLGIDGYLLANIIANFLAALYLAIRTKVWKYIRFTGLSKRVESEMLTYSRPLVINMVSWWINNASDRYVVTWLCGIAANGIYSVGYKIPSILNVFQTIFNQAWQLSTVRELDQDDSSAFYSQIYNTYNMLMVVLCSALIVLARIMADFLYAKDFFEAWKYVPFLMIAIVFGALSGFLGGIFQAYKDSKIQSQSTLIGALFNIALNFTLVLVCGPIGAAIATAISYYIVWLMRLRYAKRYVVLNIHLGRDYFAYGVLIVQSILLLIFDDSIFLYTVLCTLSIIILALYYKEIKALLLKYVRIRR